VVWEGWSREAPPYPDQYRHQAERTDPFRSAVPIDPDQSFRLIPITHSGRSRSVCGEV
jgi:hypothetical protein